jgi:hypothetical protein
MAASAGKQLHNRMPKQQCLQRRAGVRARGGNACSNGPSNTPLNAKTALIN